MHKAKIENCRDNPTERGKTLCNRKTPPRWTIPAPRPDSCPGGRKKATDSIERENVHGSCPRHLRPDAVRRPGVCSRKPRPSSATTGRLPSVSRPKMEMRLNLPPHFILSMKKKEYGNRKNCHTYYNSRIYLEYSRISRVFDHPF